MHRCLFVLDPVCGESISLAKLWPLKAYLGLPKLSQRCSMHGLRGVYDRMEVCWTAEEISWIVCLGIMRGHEMEGSRLAITDHAALPDSGFSW